MVLWAIIFVFPATVGRSTVFHAGVLPDISRFFCSGLFVDRSPPLTRPSIAPCIASVVRHRGVGRPPVGRFGSDLLVGRSPPSHGRRRPTGVARCRSFTEEVGIHGRPRPWLSTGTAKLYRYYAVSSCCLCVRLPARQDKYTVVPGEQ